MTRAAIVKELRENFPERWQISGEELDLFTDGLETIQSTISERPNLRTSVDFSKIKISLIENYRLEIQGRTDCLNKNKIKKIKDVWGDITDRKKMQLLIDLKAMRGGGWMPGHLTIKKYIPEIIKELAKGFVRPEFRFKKSKAKYIPWKAFVAESGYSEKWIKNKIEDGTIPEEMIEYGRERGQGREIISISREAQNNFKK